MNLSFLPCFCRIFRWFWAVVRTVCGQFCGIFGGFFAVVGPLLHERCLSQVVPLCLVARNCTAEGYEPVCALLKCAFFAIFPTFFVFFQRRIEHGRFSCKGGRDMAGKIPTTFATSCNRPSALWASQPSLLSSSLLSTFLLRFTSLFSFFLQFFFFSPFFPLPFSFFHLFSTVFQQFSFSSSNFPFFPVFFGQGDVSLCNTLANFVHHEAPPTHRTWHAVEDDFCIFFGIFGHIQKNRVLFGETPKKEGFRVHVIGTLSFFSVKKWCF